MFNFLTITHILNINTVPHKEVFYLGQTAAFYGGVHHQDKKS